MRILRSSTLALVAVASLASADTLVLRDGRRVDGTLEGVRGDTIEFRTSRGRTERFERSDVRRIELESEGYGSQHQGDDQFGSGRPSGLREKAVSVAADQQWTDTGVRVRSGDKVYFECSGKITWGKDRRDDCGGEGSSHTNAGRPIPNRPGGSLVGRIGNGDPFFIGKEEGPVRMRDSGTLYLGVNDDMLFDNTGYWRVTVRY